MNILTRYVLSSFLRAFVGCMTAGVTLFLIVDFFQRLDSLVRPNSTAADIASYFLFKIPNMIPQIYPAAALMAVLLSLGMLARRHEIVALRACGISVWQLAVPLLGVTVLMSGGILLWNETIVPPMATRSRIIKNLVIKQKQDRGDYNASSIWFQSRQGFVNIDYFDANRQALYGLAVYETTPDFKLQRMLEVPDAIWRDGAWQIESGIARTFGPKGAVSEQPIDPSEIQLEDTPTDLRKRRRKSYEFSYAQLKREVDLLRDKGLDASEFLVDMHHKLASPFSGVVAVFLGFPLAVRGGGRRHSIGYNITLALIVGFAYWVTMALFLSAGHTGRIPPLAAAWAANALFLMVGGVFYLGRQG